MKAYISELIEQSLTELAPSEAEAVLNVANIDVSYPKPGFGDYATNAAMVLFKQFNSSPATNPAAFAEDLAARCAKFDKDQTFSKIESVGGFINFTLTENYLLHNLSRIIEFGDMYGASNPPAGGGAGQTIIVEYFQNNIAKPPHVGHLRSAVIGDSLMRILKFLNYKAMSDTHVGDWGTQFGILLYAYKTLGNKEIVEKDPIQELNKLYVEMSAKIEEDPELRDLGKVEFQKLEQGDSENKELWKWFIKVSMDDFERYRNMLDLLPFDLNLGESFYENQMDDVLKELGDKKLLTTGETGEIYVDLEEQGLGRCILVKSDGATTYHLRDFATYIYRRREFDYYRNLYVVDNRQSHHFRQLFKVLEMAGYPAETDSAHLEFGFMSLPEGAISTRKGNTVSLENLIGEAKTRAMAIIEEKNPELKDKATVANQVALSAIKYFDLSHNRSTEIVFTWEKALSFDGNTGPYLQYTHARIHGILRKGEVSTIPTEFNSANVKLSEFETAVLRKLNQFPEIIQQVTVEYTPNILCNYLFETSQAFNAFYQEVQVLSEEDEGTRNFRIGLIAGTAQVLKNGLYLLGIEAPQEM